MTDTSLTWWQWGIVGLFVVGGFSTPTTSLAGKIGGIIVSGAIVWAVIRYLNEKTRAEDDTIHEEW